MARTPRARARLLGCGIAAAAVCCPLGFVPAPGATPTAPTREAAAAAAVVVAAVPAEAWAKGGQWGPLEGKASSLVHPIMMATLFFVTLYTGYLGWQSRQVRTLGAEVSGLRKQLPKDPEKEESSATKSLRQQISELDSERKQLIKGNFRDNHFALSSLILGGGIFFTLYGVFNTWFRAEKLFPGPHLFAGAGIVACWALSAALVPYMEKGNEGARTAHIGLNCVNLLLFAWQLPTGFEIAQKVWGLEIAWF
ncbi:unnamed protein product [Effrenium voratum]|uniref:DUF4079 domain-containing protein n=1 Tax=Effrenium voratum TaxID=2562239 RepID=A0AA36JFG0_9DINO|nr:unnamed protein product [Effrenium voratum]CAJ1404684.1 unnamed protein product [Effrenium voratum]CAJ1452473.1 unnamed protein product [Effrenium voratum]